MANPFTRRQHKGNVPAGNLLSDITAGALSFTLRTGQGANWPDGSVGAFVAKFNRGGTTEEKVLCTSRTGDAFVVAANGRGYDDTVASAQTANFTVEHVGSAQELDEANVAVVNTVGKITAIGDMLVGAGANALNRLGIGSSGQVLTVVGGTAAWTSGAASGVASFNARTGAVVPVASDYSKTHRMSWTYAISGAVGNVTLPLFEVGLAAGESKTIAKIVTKLSAGTINAQLTRNGTNNGGAIAVTSSRLVTANTTALADADDLAVVLSGGASSPADLSFTIEVDSVA